MYRLAIVDDEEIIRRGLQRVVDWNALGFDIAGVYQSTEELLADLSASRPDVVLVDIRLPKRSGLDLIRDVRRARPAARFVILSGFDSFQYAQKAIDLDVFAYLLKPVKTAEITEVFSRLRDEIDLESRRQDEAIDNHLERIARALAEDQPVNAWADDWAAAATTYGWLARPDWLLTIIDIHVGVLPVEHSSVVRSPESIRWQCVQETVDQLGGTGICVFGSSTVGRLFLGLRNRQERKTVERVAKAIIESVADETVRAAFSGATAVVTRVNDDSDGQISTRAVAAAAQNAATAIQRRLKTGINQVLTADPTSSDHGESDVYPGDPFQPDVAALASIAERCASRFIQNDEEGVLAAIRECFDVIALVRVPSVAGVQATLVRFFHHVDEQLAPYGFSLAACEAHVDDFITSVMVIPHFETIRTELEAVLVRALACYRKTSDRPHNHVVSAALEIITRRYNTDLTLESVAEEVQVSPSHLSRLFRTVLDETFKEHLTAVRLSEAKQRLLESNDKIYRIADDVGFPDQRYFSDLFRKHTGMTPLQFRNQRGASR